MNINSTKGEMNFQDIFAFRYVFIIIVIVQKFCYGWIANAESQYGMKNPTSVMQLVPVTNCRFQFKNQSFGVIASPGYPLNYPRNISCEWRIEVEKNARIVLTIKHFFLVPGDQLVINDGQQKAQVYNLQNPPNDVLFLTSGNATLSLISKPNSTTTNKSNQIITSKDDASGHAVFYAMFESEQCGGVLMEETGYITVPQYIHTADRPHECIWSIISSSKDNVVTLEFVRFDVPSGSCAYSNVYIRDGDKSGGYIIGDFCEENPPLSQLRTTANVMTISYRVSPSLYKMKPTKILPSIKMFYRIVDNCGGELEGYSGSFVTPKRWKDGVFNCTWTITVPQGTHMLFKVRKWKAVSKQDRIPETVKIIDLNIPELILWQYFGNNGNYPPESLLVRSNQVRIIWSSNPERPLNAHPLVFFQGFYETVKPTNKDCVTIADQVLFSCEENDYVQCSKRCDGISDCTNENDERHCPVISSDVGISNNLDALSSKRRFEVLNRKNLKWSYYTILFVSSAGVLVIVISVIFVVDQFLKPITERKTLNTDSISEQQQRTDEQCADQIDYRRIQPPPYKEVDEPYRLLLLSQILQYQHQPPPYYSSFETTSDRTNSRNGAVSRSTFTPTALFHDTDIIDFNTVTQSFSPTPFRYSDDDDDPEAFLKEIEALKEE